MSNQPNTYVRGIVVVEHGGAPQEGVTVDVVLGAGRGRLRLGRAVTNENGRFEVLLDPFPAGSSGVPLRFEVAREKTPVIFAHGSPEVTDLKRLAKDVVLCVRPADHCMLPIEIEPTPSLISGCVFGVVKHADGTPIAGLVVKAFVVSLGGATAVNTTDTTDANGLYQINDATIESGVNLLIRVYHDPSPGEPPVDDLVLVGSSRVTFDVSASEHIDVIVRDEDYQGSSEFERVGEIVETARAEIPSPPAVSALSHTAVLYIAARYKVEASKVADYVIAYKLAALLSATAHAELIYALLQAGWPRSVSQFLASSRAAAQTALFGAAYRNVVSKAAYNARAAFFEAWIAAMLSRALGESTAASMSGVLGAAGLESSDSELLLQLWLEHTGSVSAFWTAIGENATLGAHASSVQKALSLSLLTADHAPMVGRILELVTEISEIASWDAEDWADRIDETWDGDPVGTPDGMSEEDYVALLLARAEEAFPSARARAQVLADADTDPDFVTFQSYVSGNSGFSLGGAAATGSTSGAQMARRYQRMFRVAPSSGRYAAMKSLASSFTSARDIERMGRTRFVTDYSATLGGADAALEVFQKAKALSSMASVAYTMLHPNLYGPSYAAQIARAEPTGLPNYEDLFGNADACGCNPCLSIHSPAAYLVDLLDWVDGLGGWAEAEELESETPNHKKLNVRRRDLGQLALTCDNTYRVLPYVDLVNEILEIAVIAPLQTEPWTPTYATETTLTDAELLVTPEHVQPEAYTVLAEAQYGHRVPFHLWNALSRAFLDHLGAPRWRMLRVFQHDNTGEPTPITDLAIAVEELRLSAMDVTLITESEPEDSEQAPSLLTVTRRWGVATLAELAVVKTFLKRAGVTWDELLEILHTTTANPWSEDPTPVRAVALYWADPCDLDQIELSQSSASSTTPTEAAFRRLSRFIRLWRALGGTPIEAHRTLSSFGVSDADDDDTVDTDLITSLGAMVRLERVSGQERVALRTLWSNLDTFEDRDAAQRPQRSQYERLFLDPATFPDVATSPDTWPLRLVDGEVPDDDVLLSAHLDKLAAAMRADVGAVYDAMVWAFGESGALTEEATVASLSKVYRRLILARAVGCTVAQTQALLGLSGLDVLGFESSGATDPASAADFVELVSVIRARFGVDNLLYLATHHGDAAARVAPSDAAIREQLSLLRDHLRSVAGDYDNSDETDDNATADSFEALLIEALELDAGAPPSWVADVVDIVIGDWISSYAPEPDLATAQASRWTLLRTPASTGDVALGDWLDLRAFRQQLLGAEGVAPPLTDAATRATTALRMLTWGVYRAAHRSELQTAVAEKLAGALRRTQGCLDHLRGLDLSGLLPGYEGSTPDLADVFLARDFLAFEDSDVAGRTSDLVPSGGALSTPIDDLLALLPRLHKVARLFSCLELGAEDEDWWFGDVGGTDADSFGLVDLASFSLEEDDEDASTRFAGIVAAIRLFRLRARLPGNEPGFAELLGSVTSDAADLLAGLAERCAWRQDDLDALAAAFGYDAGAPALTDPIELERLLDAAELTRRLGLDAATLVTHYTATAGSTAAYDATEAEARTVQSAARSRYPDTDAWIAAAKPVRNRVREDQRQALTGYLIDHPDHAFEDLDDLYEYFLIDVEMSPCMLTSRVVQATLSVQQFVQRNLLGLPHPTVADATEDILALTDDQRDEWEWMKNYRVWEAARKVFLYPENWIEPELRDDKTPFFKALEGELAQGELDEDRVEQATLGYLERLREVHNLHIVGYTWQYEEADGETTDVLHVIARTRSTPRVYYYRRWEDQATWTAWEKVDCGLEGDHVLPVVYNRRLMVFWANFEERSDTTTENGDTWYEVRLSWSEYANGAWSARRTSDETASMQNMGFDGTAPSSFQLHAEEVDESLVVHLCIRGDESYLFDFTIDPCTMSIDAEVNTSTITDPMSGPISAYYQGYRVGTTAQAIYAAAGTMELTVVAGDVEADGSLGDTSSSYLLLSSVPLSVGLMVSRQYEGFTCQTPFFYEDATRNLFVRYVPRSRAGLASAMKAGSFSLSAYGNFLESEEETTLPDDPFGEDAEYAYALDKHETASSRVSSVFSALESYTGNPIATGAGGMFVFEPFSHPYVCTFIKEVRRNGIFGLLQPAETGTTAELSRQQINDPDWFDDYQPTTNVDTDNPPIDEVDFSAEGAYSQYNWELFFHLPCYVARRLTADQRFQEAMDWYHCVFDPRSQSTSYEAPDRYWKIRPFLEDIGPSVTDWASFTGEDGDENQLADFEAQVAAWRDDPFNPHLLARMRDGTYQKAVFMAYLDNLIAWGDHLFRLDTMESVGEATQIYVLASQLLGDRPVVLAPETKPTAKSYDEIRGDLDAFSNVLVEIENTLPTPSGASFRLGGAPTPSAGRTAYFCVPSNARLLGYWDTVADRLFKIRHCLNIEGVARSLSLFAPPIDPALLVRARAQGMDLQTALASASETLPNHRYSVLSGRAAALAGTVRSLGSALQGALERRDAEALSLLRAEHELAMLDAVADVKAQAVAEAEAQLAGARKSLALAEARWTHYDNLIEKGWIGLEKTQFATALAALTLGPIVPGLRAVGAVLGALPNVFVGTLSAAEWGGSKFVETVKENASGIAAAISVLNSSSSLAGMNAGFKRREEDWKFQRKMAKKEQDQIQKQILAAEIRLDMARRDLANHKLQRSQSAEVDQWMRSKFTSKELYDWMVGQVSGLYFASYSLALDLARQAERAFRHELGLSSSSFVQAGHWDSLRKGLLAGERMGHDLERMDAAWLAQDVREYELTKHVSLARLDPFALLEFVTTGSCTFTVPEALFDLDCPSHYFRRISNVSLSLACLSGPQAGVHVSVSLGESAVRRKAQTGAASLSVETSGGTTTIVTSTGREDAGLFQLNPGDPRYLPFERRGVVNSTWTISLCNTAWPVVDLNTLSDVVLHLRYTAREGGTDFAGSVLSGLQTALNELELASPTDTGLAHVVSAKRDESDAFALLLAPEAATDSAVYTFTVRKQDLPIPVAQSGKTVTLNTLYAYVTGASAADWADGASLDFTSSVGVVTEGDPTLTISRSGTAPPAGSVALGDVLSDELTLILTLSDTLPTSHPGLSALNEEDKARIDGDKLDDLHIILVYELS